MAPNIPPLNSHSTISIVGVGAMSSVGLDAPSTAAAIRAGISNFQEHPFMINQEGEPYMLALVPSIDPALMGIERYVELITPAMLEALQPLRPLASKVTRLSVAVGLPEARPGMPPELESELIACIKNVISTDYHIEEVKTIAKGHAAGALALQAVIPNIVAGEVEFALVGGVDTYLDPDTLDWIEDHEQLHIPTNAWGFIPGEAAGFCLICTAGTAKKYGLVIKSTLLGVSHAIESNRIKTETVCIGEGLTKAVKLVVDYLPADTKIDDTLCDQNGEAYRADEHGFMLCRLSEYFSDPTVYSAPADCWGDVGASSALLFIVLAVAANQKGYARGTTMLLWVSSEGGDRAAALVARYGKGVV